MEDYNTCLISFLTFRLDSHFHCSSFSFVSISVLIPMYVQLLDTERLSSHSEMFHSMLTQSVG